MVLEASRLFVEIFFWDGWSITSISKMSIRALHAGHVTVPRCFFFVFGSSYSLSFFTSFSSKSL